MTDLIRALERLRIQEAAHKKRWRYYDGDQPYKFSTERIREAFGQLRCDFVENWCSVIADATLERIELTGFNLPDEGDSAGLGKTLESIATDTRLYSEADQLHQAVIVCGEGFMIAEKDSDETIQVYYNDPASVCLFYDQEHPRKKDFAAKWWVDDDKRVHIMLYHADRFEHHATKADATQVAFSDKSFALQGEATPNPTGEIPVFHFRRSLRGATSDFEKVLPLQDMINKLLSDLAVSAEFNAFNQRWIITNADLKRIPIAPGATTRIPAGSEGEQPSEAGQWPASDLGQYIEALDRLASSASSISRTPKHYFMKQEGAPSGEALHAMEAPLVAKVRAYNRVMAVDWSEFAAFLLKLAGKPVKPSQIVPQFANPQTVQPLTLAQTRQANTGAGMPLETQVRDEGWTENEIQQMRQDRLESGMAAVDVRTGGGAPLKQMPGETPPLDMPAALQQATKMIADMAMARLAATGAVDKALVQ